MLVTEREWDTMFDQAREGAKGIVGFKLVGTEDGGAVVVTCTDMHDVYTFFAAAGAVLSPAEATELARNGHTDIVFDGGSPNGFVRLTLDDLQVTESLTGTPKPATPELTEEQILDRIFGRSTTSYRRIRRDLDQSDVDADGARAGDE
jgi:hypothetical protein